MTAQYQIIEEILKLYLQNQIKLDIRKSECKILVQRDEFTASAKYGRIETKKQH